MISLNDFKNTKEFIVNSFDELLSLCKELREKSDEKYTIRLNFNGRIHKKIKFTYSNFHIIGNNNLTLEYDLYAKKLDDKGEELTTWKTATLIITGSNNIFENFTIENSKKESYLYGQEVALAIYGTNNLFINITMISEQDTLFSGPLPDDLVTRYTNFMPDDERFFEGIAKNYFYNCDISGTIDFIFGAGQAIFYKCNLISIKEKRIESYVCAPANSLKDDFGYYFEQCNFKSNGILNKDVYLARPWRDYGKAIFSNCNYENHIKDEGFSDWSNVNRTETCRFYEFPLKKGRISFVRNKSNDTLPEIYSIELNKLKKSINE